MGMDRNTIIGFVLLGVLLFLYLFISSKNSQELSKQRQHYEDSLARLDKLKKIGPKATADTTARMAAIKDTTGFGKALYGTEELVTVENDLMRVVFSNKGGQPKGVYLKNYQSYDSTPVRLISDADRIAYPINTGPNQTAMVSELYFNAGTVTKNNDNSQVVSFQMTGPGGEQLTHQFVIKQSNYAIDWNIQASGADKLFSQGKLNISWHAEPRQQQKDVRYERQLSNICFSSDNDFDYISSKTERNFDKPVQWVAVAQQFFNSILLAKNGFTSGNVHWARETSDTGRIIAKVETNLQAAVPAGSPSVIPLQLYYGPNDYKILKSQAPGMDKIVNLGRDMYSFVRPINIYIIMPVFNFFKKFIASYGVVILLLTLFIRLLTSPLIYKSYLSGAKMKVLRPEMDALKKISGRPADLRYGTNEVIP